ncbi:MAG: hypothetical protein M1365_07180, partial [Actinobacteria bacterium]|nr:hypothetical protein [Actinomycetota bacterium]
MNLFYSLPKNILQKINFLQQDYVGFAINIDVFGIFLVSMLFAIFIVFLSYAFGKKISAPISNKSKNDYDYLFFTAIGYIAMSSGIAILGLLSLFN